MLRINASANIPEALPNRGNPNHILFYLRGSILPTANSATPKFQLLKNRYKLFLAKTLYLDAGGWQLYIYVILIHSNLHFKILCYSQQQDESNEISFAKTGSGFENIPGQQERGNWPFVCLNPAALCRSEPFFIQIAPVTIRAYSSVSRDASAI